MSLLDFELNCPTLIEVGCASWNGVVTSPDLPFRHCVGTIKISIYTLQIPSRHPLDIIQTPSVHHPDTLPTPSKDTSDNIQTPFRHPPNFKHVGSFLVLEARCGLFFLPSSSSVGKQSQLLLKPTEVELGLQVGVEFDKN